MLAEPILSRYSRPVRVGYIKPAWALGGHARGVLNNLQAAPTAVTWSAIGIGSIDYFDPKSAAEAVSVVPLYCHQADPQGLITKTGEAAETFQRVIDESDVVCLWGFLDGRPFRRLNWRGRTVIASAHGACEWTTRMLRALLPYCHLYTAVSHAAARAFPSELRPRVRVIYNGVNSSRLVPRASRESVRAAWGLHPNEIAIGFVGRYAPDKNPTAVALAARELGAPYRAVYVGSGYQEERVRRAVLSLCPNAIFAPHTPHVGNVLAAIDVYLLASPSEGHCQGLSEAWGFGVPTVSTRVGATPELESCHGRLTVPVEVGAGGRDLARAVVASLDPTNREVVERAKSVQSQFTHHATARAWADFLTAR